MSCRRALKPASVSWPQLSEFVGLIRGRALINHVVAEGSPWRTAPIATDAAIGPYIKSSPAEKPFFETHQAVCWPFFSSRWIENEVNTPINSYLLFAWSRPVTCVPFALPMKCCESGNHTLVSNEVSSHLSHSTAHGTTSLFRKGGVWTGPQ